MKQKLFLAEEQLKELQERNSIAQLPSGEWIVTEKGKKEAKVLGRILGKKNALTLDSQDYFDCKLCTAISTAFISLPVFAVSVLIMIFIEIFFL